MHSLSEQVRSEFTYNPDTGLFFRKSTGKKAGSISKKGNGYLRIQIYMKGKTYRAHRLAWAYMTGENPPKEIDHIDRDATNNKWSNLRESVDDNQKNKSMHRNNKSGVSGVSWSKVSGKWAARVWGSENGKKVYKNLGLFSCLQSAADAVSGYRSVNGYSDGHGMLPVYSVENA